jgi:hypothetical protein
MGFPEKGNRERGWKKVIQETGKNGEIKAIYKSLAFLSGVSSAQEGQLHY